MKKRGRFEREKPKRRMKKSTVTILILLAIFVALIAVGVYFASKTVDDTLDKITQVTVPEVVYTQATTAPQEEATSEATIETTVPHVASSEDYINILVVGQAAREGEMERRADTAILVTINTYEKTLTMTSFLRDTLVSGGIRYEGKNIGSIKLNTVYHLGSHYVSGTQEEKIAGSMYLMNQFLYKDYGIEVDHNIEVDFNAFIKAINLLGGIRIKLTEEEVNYLNEDDKTFQEVTVGENYLMGDAALAYARMRKAEGDSDSDIKRTARQRYVIEATLEKLKYKRLSSLQSLADEVLPMIATSMNTNEIKELMGKLIPILPDLEIIGGGTCPAYGTYKGAMKVIYKETGIKESVLEIYDWTRNKQIMRSITEGEPHPDGETPETSN